tara:strand:+ start:649 stop:786 length:138 start_codon:yes stop_codon:yes gene_type:complete
VSAIEIALNNIGNFDLYQWVYFAGLILSYSVVIALVLVIRIYKKD